MYSRGHAEVKESFISSPQFPPGSSSRTSRIVLREACLHRTVANPGDFSGNLNSNLSCGYNIKKLLFNDFIHMDTQR